MVELSFPPLSSVDLGDIQATLTNWKVNLPAGTEVVLSVIDAKDQEAWSKKVT